MFKVIKFEYLFRFEENLLYQNLVSIHSIFLTYQKMMMKVTSASLATTVVAIKVQFTQNIQQTIFYDKKCSGI